MRRLFARIFHARQTKYKPACASQNAALTVEKQISYDRITQQIIAVFHALYRCEQTQARSADAMREVCGFYLLRKPSTIVGAGSGLHLIGTASVGSVITVYPGTVYVPGDPVLLPSLWNEYLVRRSDGFYVDGKYWGISRMMYKSAAARNSLPGFPPYCDLSWLQRDAGCSESFRNPFALGHLINHTPTGDPNVMYFEYDFPIAIPPHLRTYIPNVHYAPPPLLVIEQQNADAVFIKGIVMIALRKIHNEELFSDYCFIGRIPPKKQHTSLVTR